jgi:hypothetical protein
LGQGLVAERAIPNFAKKREKTAQNFIGSVAKSHYPDGGGKRSRRISRQVHVAIRKDRP